MIRLSMSCALAVAGAWIGTGSLSSHAAKMQNRQLEVKSPRTVVSLDSDWQLYRMPNFDAWPAEAQLSADHIRRLEIPDPGKGWERVHLPDDYVVRGEFSREPNKSMLAGGAVCALGARECELPHGAPPEGHPGDMNRAGRNAYTGHGSLPLYPAWYLRSVTIPAADKGKNIWLDFGGVYRDAAVFVNGKFIDQHASGYTSFRLNVTSAIRYGDKNVIAVFVDPRWLEGWWYEGGGIYRHVRLIVTDKLHVSPWGTFVNPAVTSGIRAGSPLGDRAAAHLEMQTTVRNDTAGPRSFNLISQVVDPAGKVVASATSSEKLASAEEQTFRQQVDLPDALLWSLEKRNRYTLKTILRVGQTRIDEELTRFGIRKIDFDPARGFFLNGRRVELDGMCVHQDFPGVGIAAPDNLWSWRIQKLQAVGTNAYRTAHNPLPEEFYDAADEMGMLVMDETRHLGDTYFPKATADTPFTDLSDVKAMVLQHRNHPSIIMWSLANEEGQQGTPYGAKIFAATRDAVRKIDPSRPTTSAMNGGFNTQGFISVEDILGINYHSPDLAKLHKQFPNLMMYGSEDSNAKTSRGTLETSPSTALCSEYSCENSLNSGPWNSWVPAVENSFFAGQFVWAAFDYRGEPNHFNWPAVTSQVGIMDLAGFPKPVYYYWKAAWTKDPIVYIAPDWNLPASSTGKNVLVRAFSNCDEVELLLNGKSLGKQSMPPNKYLDWQVPYAPGTLMAMGYRQGSAVARYTVATAGSAERVTLTAEVARLSSNGEDVAPIAVALLDSNGRTVSNADREIEFTVSGAGTLAGVANGNPVSHDANFAPHCSTFRGLCMVLVKAGNAAGTITVEAHAEGLESARIVVPVTSTAPASR